MSAGPSTQTTCIHGSQSTREHDASHSTQHVALFYLFQEVSKLASPIHNTFLDTNSPPTWLKETSQQRSFMVKKEKEETHPRELSNSSCQHSLPHMMPHMKKVRDESHNSKIKTAESPPERNSPWKVLSLINLQCEKLLHHSDVEETDSGLAFSATPVGHLVDEASAATANATDEEAGGDCLSFEFTFRPSLLMCEKENIPSSVPSEEDARDYNEGASTSCVIDSKVSCVQSDTVRPELVEENATARIKREDKFSVNRQFECKEDYLSSEQSSVTVTFENTSQIANIPNESLNGQLTFNSHVDRIIPMLKPELGLDYNANLVLTKEPLSETRPHPLSSSQVALHLLSVKEADHSLPRYSDRISASQLDVHALNEVNSPQKLSCCNAETNISSSGQLKPKPGPVQQEEIAPPSAHQWRTKTPRKQPHPSRSVDIQDPGFRGVTFRMDTELDDSKEQCRLLITSKYSKELCKSMRKPRVRTRTSHKSVKSSSSDEESNPVTRVSKGKVCASCCTRKTPMWRDAEDGTPLCNACGIRYKKYRVRCFNCWHIPRKEGNSNSRCLKCGNFVRLTSAQRKHTT